MAEAISQLYNTSFDTTLFAPILVLAVWTAVHYTRPTGKRTASSDTAATVTSVENVDKSTQSAGEPTTTEDMATERDAEREHEARLTQSWPTLLRRRCATWSAALWCSLPSTILER